jgi:UDP-GlcNAc:undecaprenyl-phosphate/decaprenyl-phosphate GlcNAc-1-phosphate transferase
VSFGGAAAYGGGALAVSVASTPAVIWAARRLGVVDRPGLLKPHATATPYLGGVAVAGGTSLAVGFVRPWLILPLAMAVTLGVWDDASPLPPVVRLVGGAVIGAVVAVLEPTRLPGALGPVVVVAATIVLINGFNLLDGLDMLAGGVALVGAGGFAVLLGGDGRIVGLGLAGAVAGFLVYNRPPARVYLGDGGSYLIGTAVAELLTSAWGRGSRVCTAVAALLVVAVPVAEVALAILRRKRSGRPLLAGDRGHPYDRLVRRGWRPSVAVAAYVAAELFLVVASIAARPLSAPLVGMVVACAGALVLIVSYAAGFLSPDRAEEGR